jgi:hypothetical protein
LPDLVAHHRQVCDTLEVVYCFRESAFIRNVPVEVKIILPGRFVDPQQLAPGIQGGLVFVGQVIDGCEA